MLCAKCRLFDRGIHIYAGVTLLHGNVETPDNCPL